MTLSSTTQSIIDRLELAPLPVCNGYFRETWRDDHSTVIYWLMPATHRAGLHSAEYPEIYTYHAGTPLRFTLLHPNGDLTEVLLGPDPAAGHHPHLIVPPGVWQAADPTGEYTLASVVVAPPFRPDIVRTADAVELTRLHPRHAAAIRALS
ncbi:MULTISPECIES: cupin domain-containing protein [unclassified Nocardia]|uniref:cupin domain-containing protein n=1 Tax=unclassified Nocardia TaxID=2637762 RepID=UPI001CE40DCE|nr:MULTISPECIES: cupin domain-containing protein [unclassified Nocardia]